MNSVILCGIESHVCVLNTALDLIEEGYQVFLPVDAVSSRSLGDRYVAYLVIFFIEEVNNRKKKILFSAIF